MLTLELSQSYEVAIGLLEKIEQAITKLAYMPHIGSYPRYAHLRREGFRGMIVDKYLVFYKRPDESQTVTIYHIVDSRTDYRRSILT